jgi:hypothetical protein
MAKDPVLAETPPAMGAGRKTSPNRRDAAAVPELAARNPNGASVLACGAITRSGQRCKGPAMANGRCRMHGGPRGKKSRYGDILKHPRIREILIQIQDDPDPLNVAPEVELLRTLVVDFVNRWEESTEALLAWHASWAGKPGSRQHDAEKKLRQLLTILRLLIGPEDEAGAEGTDLFPPELVALVRSFPSPSDDPKPRQVLDIVNAAKFISEIGSLTERIQKAKEKDAVTMATLSRVVVEMKTRAAQAIAAKLPDGAVADEALRSAVLGDIERRWGDISTDDR